MTPFEQRIQAKLDATIERAMKMVVLEVDKELRRKGTGTPVDTGHARANWIPSVSHPHTNEEDGTSSAAHDAGVASVLSYKLASGTLYVSNNVPYIRRLNEGHSAQAPALFVEAAVDRAMSTVRRKMPQIASMQSSFRAYVGASGAENMASAYSPFDDN